MHEQGNGRHGGHQVDEDTDGQGFAQKVVPARYGLGQVEGQAAVANVVADQDRAGQGQHDHDGIPLVPEKVAERLGAAIEFQGVAERLDERLRIAHDPCPADLHFLLAQLRGSPCHEILAEEEQQKDHQSQRVDRPEELAVKQYRQRDTGDRPGTRLHDKTPKADEQRAEQQTSFRPILRDRFRDGPSHRGDILHGAEQPEQACLNSKKQPRTAVGA